MIVLPGVARANQVFVLCLWGKRAAMSQGKSHARAQTRANGGEKVE
ncbi:hypothetical protein LMG24238_03868 [Paraburkholderia sediminicola]|uniref:Uncharacterized protein n=1 Tax=Paraburkholderia sediminicola TaxID=458836 RepID=A0A6J5BGA3_9BURK|nr:hypothetical protein LMG24238_03868 [Paraburkholderia sediminicola]